MEERKIMAIITVRVNVVCGKCGKPLDAFFDEEDTITVEPCQTCLGKPSTSEGHNEGYKNGRKIE
jgi:hypothetical protein